LEDLGRHDQELSVVITDDERIARLNESYLARKGPTNVIAFPLAPFAAEEPGERAAPMLGDVVVSLETAEREARESGEDPAEALDRLLLHGLLHLLGYDHENPKDAARMNREAGRLRRLFGSRPDGRTAEAPRPRRRS
jgi:probable rRNA maturation factor